VTSLSCHYSYVWTDYVTDIITSFIYSWAVLTFLTNMIQKCKSTSPSAIQVKNP